MNEITIHIGYALWVVPEKIFCKRNVMTSRAAQMRRKKIIPITIVELSQRCIYIVPAVLLYMKLSSKGMENYENRI